MLQLESVDKRFGRNWVVRGVDLVVEAGRTAVLIGPSGCGKSTVLRLMIGLIRPDRGGVRFDGDLLRRASLRRVRHRIGYVIQSGGLFPHMTARANVTLMSRQLRWAPSRVEKRLDELVELTKFPRDGLDRYPAELSGGQRQRVALMRALMLDPDLLLLDEPLGALDPMIRFDLQTDLRAIFERLSKTVILVTHDLAEAAYFADEIVLMRDGRVVQRGPLADLLERPSDAFVSQFVRAQRVHTFDGGEAS